MELSFLKVEVGEDGCGGGEVEEEGGGGGGEETQLTGRTGGSSSQAVNDELCCHRHQHCVGAIGITVNHLGRGWGHKEW